MKTGSFFKVLLIWSLKQDTHFILFLFFTKLSEDDKVKLTVAHIKGTLAGTLLYLAPEITRSEIYKFRRRYLQLGNYAVGDVVWTTSILKCRSIVNTRFVCQSATRPSPRACVILSSPISCLERVNGEVLESRSKGTPHGPRMQ